MCTISRDRVRLGRAYPAEGWVPAILSIFPASSPAPTWAEQRRGVQGRGRGSVCSAWDGSAGKAASPSRAPATATHPGSHPLCHLGRDRRTLTYSPVPVGLFLLPPSGAASQPPGCSVSRTHCQDLAPLHTQHIMQGNQGDAKEQDTEEAKGDDSNDLYYPTCRQFFSSLHNKKEHLLGKQHLQNLTGEFEKDSTEYWKHLEPLEGEEGQNLSKGHSEEDTKGPGGLPPGGLIPEKSFASFNLGFLQEFIFKLQKSKVFPLALLIQLERL
ncbi:Zinc finger protein 346 [Manis javanica]|nr:Zinc finger protein 346 [Manis javanica]